MIRYARNIGSQSLLEWKPIKKWKLPYVGAEGFTWAHDVQSFYICIDTAQKTGKLLFLLQLFGF